jgi:PhoH-like ATPase
MSAVRRPTDDPYSTYVLDTCVLLADPNAIHRFDEHAVVLPLVVIEELDRKKTAMDDVGRNARHALRLIEELRAEHGTGLADAVPLPGGGTFRIESNHVDVQLPPYLDPHKADHRILAATIGLHGTLVTKDAALRIKGAQLGVATEDYRGDTHPVAEHYEGVRELDVEPHVIDELHRDGKVRIDGAVAELAGEPLFVNECLVMKAGRSASALGRVIEVERGSEHGGDEFGVATVHKVHGHRNVFGMSPRDVRQTFAIDLLLDPNVPCVSLMGYAGTGKTFLALAAGLEQVLEATAYRRVSVYRPLIAVGRQEVGYLPGSFSGGRGWKRPPDLRCDVVDTCPRRESAAVVCDRAMAGLEVAA